MAKLRNISNEQLRVMDFLANATRKTAGPNYEAICRAEYYKMQNTQRQYPFMQKIQEL